MIRHARAFILLLFLFTVAFLPRFLALSAFLTPDEFHWIGRSREFLIGILSQEWAATLQTEHPGVTTMWTGSLGILYQYWTRPPSAPDDLLTFVRQVPSYPPDVTFLAPMRFPTVLLMSLFIVAFYALVSRLFDDKRVGVVAALLLALNPFHIALSRVLHHDALVTAFMTISLLPLIGYLFKGWSWHWLQISGVSAGLAFLSKSPALFLIPFFVLGGMIWLLQRRNGQIWSDVRQLVDDGFFWYGMAWLTIFLLWPAIRVIPTQVVRLLFDMGHLYATEGHGWGNFFLGQITHDPGPLFYPLNWLLRTTPLELLGLLIWGCISLQNILGPKQPKPAWKLSNMLLLYAALFMIFMTLGAKKQERYILPIYPALDVLAALGLVQLSTLKFRLANLNDFLNERIAGLLIVVGFLLQVGLLFGNSPYYLTYYNPLFGGATTAARLTTVGWGEGLDQAATYLNTRPDAAQLHITSWYAYSLAPFFRGQVFASEGPTTDKVLSSDVTVIYRNQIQRQLPNAELIHYFLTHQTPSFSVTLQGLDYVYVYDIPLTQRSNWQISRLPQKAIFFGIGHLETADVSTFSLTLYWQNEGLRADEGWWVALQPVNEPIGAWQSCQLRPDFADERLMIGALLESECQLAHLPLGSYHLHVGIGRNINDITPIPLQSGEFIISVQES